VLSSLIICTRNRADALENTLRALARTICPSEIELLVIDNGSTDSTRDGVGRHSPFVRAILYFYEPNSGKSQALNMGLRLASGDILVLTDDDIRPTQHWLSAITRPIVAEQCDAVSGSVKIAAHLRRAWIPPSMRSSAGRRRRDASARVDTVASSGHMPRANTSSLPVIWSAWRN
jgi:glycosyltransferase involved in cell wall biosynthesis